MKKKIIITETQSEKLKQHILNEGEVFTKMVERIKKDLDMNYEPMIGVLRKGGEYSEEPMVKIKIDGESITPKALFEYLKFKYKMGNEFLKQVVSDWMFGKIDKSNRLSKNVALN